MTFKIGDRVKRNKKNGDPRKNAVSKEGDIGTITGLYPHDYECYEIDWDKGETSESTGRDLLELISKDKKSIMKKISNYYKKFTDAKVQSLVKAGYLNGDLEPTEKAHDAIKEINFFANQDELVKRADEEIAEEEANNAKA